MYSFNTVIANLTSTVIGRIYRVKNEVLYLIQVFVYTSYY